MSDEISYGGKPISQYGLWELGDFLKRIEAAEDKREAASKHIKFNADREINNKTIPKMKFPEPNPKYLEIKNAIIEEIRKKQNA